MHYKLDITNRGGIIHHFYPELGLDSLWTCLSSGFWVRLVMCNPISNFRVVSTKCRLRSDWWTVAAEPHGLRHVLHRFENRVRYVGKEIAIACIFALRRRFHIPYGTNRNSCFPTHANYVCAGMSAGPFLNDRLEFRFEFHTRGFG